jgi:hypothetical protein
MALQHPTLPDGLIEECMDEFNEFVSTLKRYPPTVIAVALSVHLQALMGALVEYEICSRDQALEFIRDLRHDLLEELGDMPPGSPQEEAIHMKPFS